MVRIYIRRTCTSSTKAIKWLREFKVNVEVHKINAISQEDLTQILSKTDEGFFALLRDPRRLPPETLEKLENLETLPFSKALRFLQLNPELLRTPIIMDKDKILIGYNDDQIRQFLPETYRRYSRKHFI